MPDGNVAPVFASALDKNVPAPFSKEPTGGGGNRMHHKFVVIDFDKPTARVYLGSYNFSVPADEKNGENLLLIRDRRIAVSYTVEALRIFDHYHFRVAQQEAKKARKKLQLARPPRDSRREALVGRRLHRCPQDPGSRAVRVAGADAAGAVGVWARRVPAGVEFDAGFAPALDRSRPIAARQEPAPAGRKSVWIGSICMVYKQDEELLGR